MSKKLAALLIAVTGLYVALFIRFPHIDYSKSTYAVACSNNEASTQISFDTIQSSDLKFSSDGPGRMQFAYMNPDSDVVAKLICAQNALPDNPQQFYNDAVKNPYYAQISNGPKNYAIVLKDREVTPTYGELMVKILVLVVSLGVIYTGGEMFGF